MKKILFVILFLNIYVFAGELIFECDFSNNEAGLYTFEQVKEDWENPNGESPSWNNGVDDGRTEIVDEIGGQEKVLAVKFPKLLAGTDVSGAQWKYAFGEKFDSATVEYKIFFPEGGDYGGGGKLPGLGGGTAPTGCNPSDGTDGFTARIMWRSGTMASDDEQIYGEQYLYFRDKTVNCGDDYWWEHVPEDDSNVNSKITSWYSFPNHLWWVHKPYIAYFKQGEWNTVRTYIKVNDIDKTEKGNSNSIIKTWLNDELVLDVRGLVLRTVDDFAVDMFYFSTFAGGSSPDFAPQTKDQTYYFDDFKIWEGEKPEDGDTITPPDTTGEDTTETAILNGKKLKNQPVLNINNRNLSVSVPNAPNMAIEIFTPNGRRILKKKITGETANIALPKSAKGIVIVTVDADRNYYSQRITVD